MTYPDPLQFKHYDVRQLGSVAALFAATSSRRRRGIYVLHFANGECYVGKTVNIVSRLASHRRHSPDIESFEFAYCAKRDLAQYEKDTIAQFELTHALRNIALTGRPGGVGTEVIRLPGDITIELPWDRDARATPSVDRPRHRIAALTPQFEALRSRPDYPRLRELIGRYIYEMIADPEDTAGRLWFLSAMPNTGARPYQRLFTLSCGGVETLRAVIDLQRPEKVSLFVNIAPRSVDGKEIRLGPRERHLFVSPGAGYRHAKAAVIAADSVDAAHRALDKVEVLDAAYQLNTELMRKGSRLFARFHNRAFADEVLDAASEVGRLAAQSALERSAMPSQARTRRPPLSRRGRAVVRVARSASGNP